MRLVGLAKRPELNGSEGVIEQNFASVGRYAVVLSGGAKSGETVKVPHANVEMIDEQAQAAAPASSWFGGALKVLGFGNEGGAAAGRGTRQLEQSRLGAAGAEGVDWAQLDALERHALLELIGRSARDLGKEQLASIAGWPLFAYDTPRPELPTGCGPLSPEGHRWHRPEFVY